MRTLLTLVACAFLLFPARAQQKAEAHKVYVNPTGTKYHEPGCRYVTSASTLVDLKDAEARYGPCKACHKETTSAAPAKPTSTSSGSSTGSYRSTTTKGQTIYTGPRGGRYHYSKSGKKVYEKRR